MNNDEEKIYRKGLYYRLIGQKKSPGWIPLCANAAINEHHQFVRSEAYLSLKNAEKKEFIPLIVSGFTSKYHSIRWRVIRILIREPVSLVLSEIRSLIRNFPLDEEQISDIIECLSLLAGKVSEQVLLELAKCQIITEKLELKIIKAIGKIGSGQSLLYLRGKVDSKNLLIKKQAVRALFLIDNNAALTMKKQMINELDDDFIDSLKIDNLPQELFNNNKIELDKIVKNFFKVDKNKQIALANYLYNIHENNEEYDQLKEYFSVEKVNKLEPIVIYYLGLAGLIDINVIKTLISDGDLRKSIAISLTIKSRDILLDLMESNIELPHQVKLLLYKQLLYFPSEYVHKTDDSNIDWLIKSFRDGKLVKESDNLNNINLKESAQWPFGLKSVTESEYKRPFEFGVAAINFSYDINLGTLIRVSEASGANEVIIGGVDFYNRKAAKGADLYIPVKCFSNLDELVIYARSKGYLLIGIQQSSSSIQYNKIQYPQKPLFIFGSEGDGIPQTLRSQLDCIVEIPVYGFIDSINVVNSASIIIYNFLDNYLKQS